MDIQDHTAEDAPQPTQVTAKNNAPRIILIVLAVFLVSFTFLILYADWWIERGAEKSYIKMVAKMDTRPPVDADYCSNASYTTQRPAIGTDINVVLSFGSGTKLQREIDQRGNDALKNIEELTCLESLGLYSNNISDITALNMLINLKDITIQSDMLADIAPIANLTNLETLTLSSNSLSNIEPIRGLTKLKSVYIKSNSLSDLSPISNLTSLKSIIIENTPIKDLTPFSDLIELEVLDISNSKISSTVGLEKLTKLESIYLWNSDIRDVNEVLSLPNLKQLWVQKTFIINKQCFDLADTYPNIDIRCDSCPSDYMKNGKCLVSS